MLRRMLSPPDLIRASRSKSPIHSLDRFGHEYELYHINKLPYRLLLRPVGL